MLLEVVSEFEYCRYTKNLCLLKYKFGKTM